MRSSIQSIFAISLIGFATWQFSPAQQPEPADLDPPKGVEVQARGPIHEAFAQPTDLKPEPGLPLPKKPPEPVPELPPDEKPEGENVQWIGGYWAWDADRNDFLWVSGVYRNTPPGRQYVPGYWTNTPDGWRWVAGFWANANQQEVPYVPEPPATLESGPSLPPPQDSLYVPGNWQYRETRFVWRPGYFIAARPGRLWIQPHYLWSPSGYVFVDGYWDYPVEDRGLLFAPVFFSRPLWLTPGYYYRPYYVVRPSFIFDAMFYRPGSFHFYFGDYYGRAYVDLGFHPWFGGPARYDPLFSYYRWNHRGDPGWYNGLRRDYDARVAGRLDLPPRTLVQQNTIVNKTTNITTINRVQGLTHLSKASTVNNNIKLTKVTKAQAETFRAQNNERHELAKARVQHETVVNKTSGAKIGTDTKTFKLPALTGTTNTDTKVIGKQPGTDTKVFGKQPGTDTKVIGKQPGTDTKVIGKQPGTDTKVIGKQPGGDGKKDSPPPRKDPPPSKGGAKGGSARTTDVGPIGQPRVVDQSPSTRNQGFSGQPRIANNPPPAPQPRIVNNPAPRALSAPRANPVPRAAPAPRAAPVPRAASAPRAAPRPPAPRSAPAASKGRKR